VELIKSIGEKGRKLSSFVHESMISCGGQVVFPKGYLQKIYKAVKEAGGVNIADEVQVGFGRMGSHFWGFQTYGDDVIPDIVAIGKPIGNGHPVAAVITTQEIANSFTTEYFNTYGGNPVSIAAANAVLDIMEEDKLMQNAQKVGKILWDGLIDLQKKYPVIGDVRGDGLFIGVDFVESPETKEPSGRIALYVIHRLKQEKIIMSSEGKYRNVLKIKPPMTITVHNAEFLLQKMDIILGEVCDPNANKNILDSQSGENGWSGK
jgi:ethanolamine-phosphate phospho-lyase